MSFDDWYKVSKWHPHLMTLDYGSIVVMVEEYAEAYAQSLQPTPSSILEASTFTDTNGEKCCSACCKPLIVSSVPEAEGLVSGEELWKRYVHAVGCMNRSCIQCAKWAKEIDALYRRQHPARKDGRR